MNIGKKIQVSHIIPLICRNKNTLSIQAINPSMQESLYIYYTVLKV